MKRHDAATRRFHAGWRTALALVVPLACTACGPEPRLEGIRLEIDGKRLYTVTYDFPFRAYIGADDADGERTTFELLDDTGTVIESRSGKAGYSGWSEYVTLPASLGPEARSMRARARCCGGQEVAIDFRVATATPPNECVWLDADGQPLPSQVPADTAAFAVARFPPELEGALTRFEVYEDDPTFDDHLLGAYALIEQDGARLPWTIRCGGDGVADNRCEFFFTNYVFGGSVGTSPTVLSSVP